MKSSLCDYNSAYTLVKGDIAIAGTIVARVAFKNYAPCIKSITKIDGTTTDDAEDLAWSCGCIICQNTIRIILKQQVVYGFIVMIKQLILMQILKILISLNLSSRRLN